jgi:hypothetical protein
MTSPEVQAFLDELITVCRKHGLSISHEDGHCNFIVERHSQWLEQWLRAAKDDTGVHT